MYVIREATISDLEGMTHLLQILFSQEKDFHPDPEAQSRGLKMILEGDKDMAMLFVAYDELEGSVVGMVALHILVSTFLGSKVAMLEDMVVDERCRGQGLGEKLLQHAIHEAKARGLGRITLLTDGDNMRAQRFYSKSGFSLSTMVPMRMLLNKL